ncbi:MAG: 2-oxo acid dehydrogenase subunit E2, partial [Desulfuromonas sp.]|nr:2-oxo acid dehydrogenase subunit E2 [Desulfuromonas sp.]
DGVGAAAEPSAAQEPQPETLPPSQVDATQTVDAVVETAPQRLRQSISPAARRLATELQVDLATVIGSGPDGVIQRDDIERSHAEKHVGKGDAWRKPVVAQDTMRQAIAAAVTRSNSEIPHYYLSKKINLQRALQWMEERNRTLPIQDRMLPVAVLVWAVATALRQVEELNGFWIDGAFQPVAQTGIGFTVALKTGGLVMPVIKGEALDHPEQTMAALRQLIRRSRSGRLSQSDMEGASISLTNMGDLGVDSVYGVIFPPQVALVGFGRIVRQPWAEGDALMVRSVVTASLAADHRATDGLTGARFLDRLNNVLQELEFAS